MSNSSQASRSSTLQDVSQRYSKRVIPTGAHQGLTAAIMATKAPAAKREAATTRDNGSEPAEQLTSKILPKGRRPDDAIDLLSGDDSDDASEGRLVVEDTDEVSRHTSFSGESAMSRLAKLTDVASTEPSNCGQVKQDPSLSAAKSSTKAEGPQDCTVLAETVVDESPRAVDVNTF